MIKKMFDAIKKNPVEAIIMGLNMIYLILILSLPVFVILMTVGFICLILLVPPDNCELIK